MAQLPVGGSSPAGITGAALVAEVQLLAKQAGNRYFYTGTSPNTGFDCSGLIYDALLKLGYANPPRTSEAQYAASVKVSRSNLQVGDLVFAQFPGDNASPGHVGIYVGGGRVLSAQDPSQGIGYSTLTAWGNNIVGYGRMKSVSTSGATGTGSAGSTGAAGPDTISIDGFNVTLPTDISDFFNDANSAINAGMWLVNPSSWLRIGAFLLGTGIFILAIRSFIAAATGGTLESQMPAVVPIPV